VNTPRPATITIASGLLLLASLFDLTTPFAQVGPPAPLSYIILGLGVCGLPVVFGVWSMKPWGLLLAIILAVLALLPPLSGLLFAPLAGKVISALVAIVYALVLVLVMLPATRKAVAAAHTPAARV
jgi:hypothetical protein